MHIASLVLGIIAIITCFIPIFGAAVSLIALIIAIAAMCIKRPNNEGKGMKIAGLVLSIIAFVISLVISGGIILGAKVIADNNEEIIQDAQETLKAADLANAKHACNLAYAQGISDGMQLGFNDGAAYNEYGNIMTAEEYYKAVAETFGETVTEIKSKYVIIVNETGMPISVEAK